MTKPENIQKLTQKILCLLRLSTILKSNGLQKPIESHLYLQGLGELKFLQEELRQAQERVDCLQKTLDERYVSCFHQWRKDVRRLTSYAKANLSQKSIL